MSDAEPAAAGGPRARVSRRELIAAGAVAAGGIYLGLEKRLSGSGRARRGRVIVVGAGLAGLAAAWELERRGWAVTVLEARRRIGGRTHTLRDFAAGQTAEAGGEFIDTTHLEMRRFARRFGLPLVDLRGSGADLEDVAYLGGRLRSFESFAGPHASGEIARFYRAAFRLARPLDPADPAAAGAQYDRRSAASLIDEIGVRGVSRQVLDRELRDDYAIEAERLSLLFLLISTKTTWNTPNAGIEVFRVAGGNDLVARGFAARLEQQPHLGAKVTEVRAIPGGVRVTAAGEEFDADHLVLAAPLPGLRGVRFAPALPDALAAAIRELQYGPITKTTLQYRQRFWRRRGFSGETFTDLPVSTAWEATDRQGGRPGILMAYASGEAGSSQASERRPARIDAIAAQLDRIYPGSEPQLGDTATVAWSNSPLNGGAYSAFAPGQVTDFWTALRRPYGEGRIHLAGEHTAELTGYMEGALRSGLRAARQIDAVGPGRSA